MTTKQTIDGVPRECRECGSTSLTWFAQNTVPNGIQQNRLNTHDVQCVFVLGCDDCSETLKIISADRIAEHFNKPATQPQGASSEVIALGIQVEKMLCEALGREWAATGISIESLVSELKVRAGAGAQPQGEPVALSADELKFLEAIAMNPGAKLNDGIASSEEDNSLWVRLEDLGLIECIGSYKWKLTFSAVELGVKAFLGQQPAPVAVVLPERRMPENYYDRVGKCAAADMLANEWNACLDEQKRLNGEIP